MLIAENLNKIRVEIKKVLISSGRKPEDIVLVAVTKTQSAEAVNAALAAGVSAIGENKVQEAKQKFPSLIPGRYARHMIGHLQTNKTRDAVRLFDVIQSVDSERLLAEIDKEAGKSNKVMECMAEVNIGGEENKSGMKPEATEQFLVSAGKYVNIRISGLMTIAPFLEDAELVRPYFRKMKALFDSISKLSVKNVKMEHLSMGMSGDYRVAVEEGATMLRIGTAIFGAREYIK
ncbi:MAG: YggS family pyridoxal phosphate-dependent enzyme [Candidatus Firestonebacteria bacterium]